MFESITFFNQNKNNASNPLDIGALVECMMFYGKTSVVANYSILRQLFTYFGIDRLVELISEDLLEIIYTETYIGIVTNTIKGIDYHDPIQFTSPQHTYYGELQKICTDITGKSGKGRRTARRIQDLVKVKSHEPIILEGAKASFIDQRYIKDSTKSIIQSLIPEDVNLNSIVFQTERTASGILIETNINFDALNSIYHKYVPPTHSTITPALLLSHMLDVESELFFSSNNLSEIATSGLSSNLISLKVNYLLDKSIKSSKKIQDFQNFVFDDAKALREAVNNKQVDLDDLMLVLKNSKKFKKWILGLNPDRDLIKSYYQEATKETFVDKLPGKTARWGLFTSAGLIADAVATGGIGTTIGLGLGALDSFYLDKLITGWKPNQFIENEVKALLKNSD
ncbi:MAG: hypothetical protein IPH06_02790 [Alphaproteobacteria bacterium]|nr:hypothetical protein [Alphaproteobacteria bacterium]QQS56970.1 MAG: hypothetical protein IPN28_12045 [Alphaproteobacteria bacterium]